MHLTPDEWFTLRENNRLRKIEADRKRHDKKFRHLAEDMTKRGPGGPGSKLWEPPE